MKRLILDMISLILFLFLFQTPAGAYPDFIRHGYTHCTACHISPSGGGVLSSYGRKLAHQFLTLHPLKNDPESENNENEIPAEPWHFGGEARFLSFYLNNEFETQSRFIPMQIQGDGSYNSENYAVVIRAGITGQGESFGIPLPSAYGMWRVTDLLNLRVGHFFPGYGLNNSMHFLGTRSSLGFGFDDLRTGVEITYLDEAWGLNVSYFGPKDHDLGSHALMAQIQYAPTDHSKIAFNYWKEQDERSLFGLWFVAPLFHSWWISADLNHHQEEKPNRKGYAYYSKLAYEARPGVNLFVMSDNSQIDTDRDYTRIDRLGPGIQIYPCANLDFELTWLKENNRLYSSKRGDYAYLLLHAYY